MRSLWRTGQRMPITVKVPIVVVCLMLAIGVAVSERVLSRLVAQQERQLDDLADAYLDGLATPLIDPVLREDAWEIFDILDRAPRFYAAVRPVETVVTDLSGAVLAASNPRTAPIGGALPAEFPDDGGHRPGVLVREAEARAFVDRALTVEGRQIGTLHAELDITPLLAERREVLWTLIVSNGALTVLFAALGWFAVRRMVAPMNVLAEHLEGARDGPVEPIPDRIIPAANTETGRLFRSFNDMAAAVAEREALLARVAEEERLAGLGRLASGVAHEVNNPLGGLFNALDTLKSHGEKPYARRGAIDLLDRGLHGIRDVVRSVLATYRPDPQARGLLAADIEDLRLLAKPEIRRKRIDLRWHNELPESVGVSAFAIRQVTLNLLLNACRAVSDFGVVAFSARVADGFLLVEVDDDGPGIPPSVTAFIADRDSAAPLAGGSGLGLWIARRMAAELGGRLEAGASPLGGARVGLSVPVTVESESLSNVA